MKFVNVCVALFFFAVATVAPAKDLLPAPARKPADDNAKNSLRDPKPTLDQWQPYFRWHRDAIAARNRDDNPAGRAPALQL